MLIDDAITIDESELEERFVRASGPGGQNVNKVATAVQLRFDVGRTAALPEPVRERLIRLAGRRVTDDGILILEARRYRTQERNRQDARERLVNLVRKALEAPKPRRPTRPTRAAKTRRLKVKRQRAETKERRKPVRADD